MKNIEQQTTERRIDEEIARRTPTMYIRHVTGISRRTEGITVAYHQPIQYDDLFTDITDLAYDLDEMFGDAFPSDIKQGLHEMGLTGVAVCDFRDQFDHTEGRIRAKRSWLSAHPRSE